MEDSIVASPTVKLDLWPSALPATTEAIRAALFGTLPKARGNLVVLDRNNGEAVDVHAFGKRYVLRALSYVPPSRIVTRAKLAVAPSFNRDAQGRFFRLTLLPRKSNSFAFDDTERLLLAFAAGTTANVAHKWIPTR